MSAISVQITELVSSLNEFGEAMVDSLEGKLTANKNLSDLGSVATAQANLEVLSEVEVNTGLNAKANAATVSTNPPSGGNPGDVWYQI